MTAEMANSYKTKKESGTRWVNHHHIHFRVYKDSLGYQNIYGCVFVLTVIYFIK